MKKNKFLVLLFLLLTYSCNNNQEADAHFLECLNSKNINAEENLKNAIFNYELYLLSIGQIEDNTGGSYSRLLRNIADNNVKNIKQPFSKNLSDFELNYEGCGSYLNTWNSKAKQVGELLLSLKKKSKTNINLVSDKLYYILNKKDLELVTYKLVVLILVDFKITNQ